MNILFFEWKNFGKEDIAGTFLKMGHHVTCIENEHIKSRYSKEFDDLFAEALTAASYDFIFTLNYSPIVSNNCNKHNLKYIAWVYDSPLLALYSYTIINPCNYVFIFDKALYLDLKKEGINTVYYVPLAANIIRLDSVQVTEQVKKVFSSDISFVGSMYNEKHNLFERLKGLSEFHKGLLDGIMAAQLKVYGYYFIEELLKGDLLHDILKVCEYKPNPDGTETPQYVYAYYFIARKLAEMERRMLLSKVSEHFQTKLYTHNPTPEIPQAINMGAIDYYDSMPYVFKCSKINLNITLRSIRSGIPLRAMDIMGAGGFLLSNYQADFFDSFVPDEDFVFFENDDDLVNKCRYYLSHEKERLQIAENGYAKMKEFHSYEKRLTEILSIVF